ncbi:MAG: LysE/ArgO family amino acid transporter [Marinobacterium sp.]|nr:LysE/ArgO family amino acid transporter [Marinobacterium sp.]
MSFTAEPEWLTLSKGLFTGGSLIIAIGAQNAWVLAQGLRRQYHWMIAALCALVDITLICAGMLGLGALLSQSPLMMDIARWGGILFLLVYGAQSMKAALKPGTLEASEAKVNSRKAALLTTLAVSLLNPHVYLDTVILLGSIGNQVTADLQSWFTLGAVLASVLWFFSLSLGARALAPLFRRPVAWQLLDAFVGLVMWGIAWSLYSGTL